MAQEAMMYIKKDRGPVEIALPNGKKLNRSDLPPVDTKRWVAGRKLVIVQAVFGGLLSKEEACEIYSLSAEELDSWCEAATQHGTSALKVTRLQRYRQPKVE